MHADLKTDLHIVAEIPQTCDCAETLCVKLLTADELSHLTQTERNRVWTLRARDGKNWLDYGVSTNRNIVGYILMPIKVKLPDDVAEEEESRAWACPGCGFEVEKTYTEMVDEGRPHCDDCDEDMELVRPPEPAAEVTAETTAETPAETANETTTEATDTTTPS